MPDSPFQYSLRPLTCNFILKEALAQLFSCKFCEISKNTFLYRTPLVAVSKWLKVFYYRLISAKRKKDNMKVATDLKNAKNAPKNPFFKSKLQAFNYEQW